MYSLVLPSGGVNYSGTQTPYFSFTSPYSGPFRCDLWLSKNVKWTRRLLGKLFIELLKTMTPTSITFQKQKMEKQHYEIWTFLFETLLSSGCVTFCKFHKKYTNVSKPMTHGSKPNVYVETWKTISCPCHFVIYAFFTIQDVDVMGWLNRLKFIGKTNRLTKMLIFTILASFVCFFNFPDRNLIILYKITWKLPFHAR